MPKYRFEVSRLVCLVEEETEERRRRCRLSGCSEIDEELQCRGKGVLLPPLLRISARPEYFKSGSSGRDLEDHGVLDSVGSLRISHGCCPFRHCRKRSNHR